jgi:hypothetical protein
VTQVSNAAHWPLVWQTLKCTRSTTPENCSVQTVQRSVHRSNRSMQTVPRSILHSNHSVQTVYRSVQSVPIVPHSELPQVIINSVFRLVDREIFCLMSIFARLFIISVYLHVYVLEGGKIKWIIFKVWVTINTTFIEIISAAVKLKFWSSGFIGRKNSNVYKYILSRNFLYIFYVSSYIRTKELLYAYVSRLTVSNSDLK